MDRDAIVDAVTTTLSRFGVENDQPGVLEMIAGIADAVMLLAEDTMSQKSSDGRTDYTRFISILASASDKIENTEVSISPNFSKSSKTKPIYEANKSDFDNIKSITIRDLRKRIAALLNGHKATQMTHSSFVWNLLSKVDRAKILNGGSDD